MSTEFCRVQLVLLRFAWKWLFKIINIAVAVWKSWPSFCSPGRRNNILQCQFISQHYSKPSYQVSLMEWIFVFMSVCLRTHTQRLLIFFTLRQQKHWKCIGKIYTGLRWSSTWSTTGDWIWMRLCHAGYLPKHHVAKLQHTRTSFNIKDPVHTYTYNEILGVIENISIS